MTDQAEQLTIEELIHLLIQSSGNEEISAQLAKLEFLIRLRFSEEEIEALRKKRPTYTVTVGMPIDEWENRVYLDLSICGDMVDVAYFSEDANMLDPVWQAFGKMHTDQQTKFYVKTK